MYICMYFFVCTAAKCSYTFVTFEQTLAFKSFVLIVLTWITVLAVKHNICMISSKFFAFLVFNATFKGRNLPICMLHDMDSNFLHYNNIKSAKLVFSLWLDRLKMIEMNGFWATLKQKFGIQVSFSSNRFEWARHIYSLDCLSNALLAHSNLTFGTYTYTYSLSHTKRNLHYSF